MVPEEKLGPSLSKSHLNVAMTRYARTRLLANSKFLELPRTLYTRPDLPRACIEKRAGSRD